MATATTQTADQTAYRAAILAGETPTQEILSVAWRYQVDAVTDASTLEKRKRAVEELAEADQLQKRADAIVVPTVDSAGGKVSDYETVAELAGAIEVCQAMQRPNFVPAEKIKKAELQGDASSIRAEALRTLRQTADPALGAEADSKRQSITGLQGRIRSRITPEQIDRQTEELRQKIERFANGKRGMSDNPRLSMRELRVAAEEQLQELLAERPQAVRDAKQSKADQKRIAKLQGEIAELEKQKLDPERMGWAGE